MKICWFSWKDIGHPLAGGAETVSWQIMRRLVKDGHQVYLITALYGDSNDHETVDGVEIFRTGGRLSVYVKARRLFRKNMADWPDLIVDEMNTIPFGAAFYSRKRSLLLAYQLAREIWFFQMPFPISVIGYLLEPLYLFGMSWRYRLILTESQSSRQDFSKYGFAEQDVKVFRVGIDLKPVESLTESKDMSGILVLGAMRPMKRTLHAVKAFELARDQNPALKLTIAGDAGGRYAARVIRYIKHSRHSAAIKVLGRVSPEQRLEIMRQSALILVTSIKEGWGLIVTEANSQGAPAIAYNVDGLRDSVRDGETGLLVKSGDEMALGLAINHMLSDKSEYKAMRERAWLDSQQYTFSNCYADFTTAARISPDQTNQ